MNPVRFTPRPSSLLSYIVATCDLQDDNGGPEPIRLEPIPRPDLIEKLQEQGGLVTKVTFTTHLPGLQTLAGNDETLLGLSWNPEGDDAPVNDVLFTVSARIDTRARKQETMGARGRATARRLIRAAEKLVAERDEVIDGEISLLDDDDKRHVITLAEESLATRWPLPQQESPSLGHDTVHSAIHNAYEHWRQHIDAIVAGSADGDDGQAS